MLKYARKYRCILLFKIVDLVYSEILQKHNINMENDVKVRDRSGTVFG